ncbi:MAG: hypothetical protein ACW98F_15920 [Candidatus Hodarchaeales archaeon]|jgi:hypothetical protein
MNISEIILIFSLSLIPQLGLSLYNYFPKKRLIRAQILNESLYVFLHGRQKLFLGGIIVHEPRTISDESAVEFLHQIQEYLPLTLKLVKNCDQTCIFIYPFDKPAKLKLRSIFDSRIQKIANIFETQFTPRKIQIITGRELIEMLRDEYRKIHFLEVDESHIHGERSHSRVFELGRISHGGSWNRSLNLLNCILELGLEVSLAFSIKIKNTHLYSSAHIQISSTEEESLREGIKIIKKGGPLLLTSTKEIEFENSELNNKLSETSLQILPFPEQETNLRNIAFLIQFFVQNASKKHSFSTKDRNSHLFLEKHTIENR